MRQKILAWFLLLAIAPGLLGAAPLGGRENNFYLPGNPPGLVVASGYFLFPAITKLDFPTAIAFDPNQARAWISEAGIAGQEAEVLVVDKDGVRDLLHASDLEYGRLSGPLTDLTFYGGWLWLAHRQLGANGWWVGTISRFLPEEPVDSFTTVITNLPGIGDHPLGEIVFGSDGRLYFSIGAATNSGVVGPDNYYQSGWLKNTRRFHDFPPVDVVLNGGRYQSADPNSGNRRQVTTSPFQPFGGGPLPDGWSLPATTPTNPQQGMIAGNGAVYSLDPVVINPAASLRLEAWGLHSGFGLAFDPASPERLFVSNQSTNRVGLRPIARDADDLFALRTGGDVEFYGWPDFFHDPRSGWAAASNDRLFCRADVGMSCPELTFDEDFLAQLEVQPAVVELGQKTGSAKFDISTSRTFGAVGDLFLAESGSLSSSGGTTAISGFRVARVSPRSGQVSSFISHAENSPDSIFDPQSLNRPVDVKFFGQVMAIVDYGVYEPGLGLQQANTGKVWLAVSWRTLLFRRAARSDPPAFADWAIILRPLLNTYGK